MTNTLRGDIAQLSRYADCEHRYEAEPGDDTATCPSCGISVYIRAPR